jgi:hypothetical protein
MAAAAAPIRTRRAPTAAKRVTASCTSRERAERWSSTASVTTPRATCSKPMAATPSASATSTRVAASRRSRSELARRGGTYFAPPWRAE